MKRFQRGTQDWQDVAAPLVLLVTGVLLTSGACLQWLSFDKMQSLWPAGLILSGLAGMLGPDATRR